jgi:hypothetical protein
MLRHNTHAVVPTPRTFAAACTRWLDPSAERRRVNAAAQLEPRFSKLTNTPGPEARRKDELTESVRWRLVGFPRKAKARHRCRALLSLRAPNDAEREASKHATLPAPTAFHPPRPIAACAFRKPLVPALSLQPASCLPSRVFLNEDLGCFV